MTVAVVVLLMGMFVLIFWLRRVPGGNTASIAINYVGHVGSGGLFSDKPTFWVTNHTDKTLMITLRTVEVQNGQNWMVYAQVLAGPLYFSKRKSIQGWLGPHEAGYGVMLAQRIALPTNAVWRVRASVAEKLAGIESVVAAIASVPRTVEARYGTGNTNIPMNPFGKDLSHHGHHSEVLSGEVTTE